MKKLCIFISLFLILFLICGCDSTTTNSKMQHKHCVRNGALTGAEVVLEYDIYYTGSVLNLLKSTEGIVTTDQELLNTYEEAYKKIHVHYEGLKNYDTKVIRNDDSVTSIITINYDKIDMDKLIEIEGNDSGVYVDKKANVDKWLELAKKLGTTCELVED